MLRITNSVEDAHILPTEPIIILIEINEPNLNVILSQTQTDALPKASKGDQVAILITEHNDTQHIIAHVGVPYIFFTAQNLEEVGNKLCARVGQIFSRSLTIYSGRINCQWDCLHDIVNQILALIKYQMVVNMTRVKRKCLEVVRREMEVVELGRDISRQLEDKHEE